MHGVINEFTEAARSCPRDSLTAATLLAHPHNPNATKLRLNKGADGQPNVNGPTMPS